MSAVLRRKATLAKTGLCTSSLYAMMAKDKFPRPIPLGARAVGWLESEVDDWIRARAAERTGPRQTPRRRAHVEQVSA
jgi:prophage regulatory protein